MDIVKWRDEGICYEPDIPGCESPEEEQQRSGEQKLFLFRFPEEMTGQRGQPDNKQDDAQEH